jgi:photosystem II stability/assembly factor-like uncharacterized protein
MRKTRTVSWWVLWVAVAIFQTVAASAPTLSPGTWVNITPANVGACTDLQFDAAHRSTLWAAFGGNGVYQSTDGGSSWVQKGSFSSLGRVRVDPNNSNHLYWIGSVSGATLGFYLTTDGGTTWTMPPAFAAGASKWTMDMYNMAVDPSDFNHVIISSHSGWAGFGGDDAGVLETKDGGASFIAHDPVAGMNHGQGIAFLYDQAKGLGNSNTWLLGGGYAAGIYRTTDGGSTWTEVSKTIQDNHGGFDLHYSSTTGFAYIGGYDGLFRSTDNGITWATVLGSAGGWYSSVIGDGHHLYSGQSFVGVDYNLPYIESTEGGGANEGSSWSNMSTQKLPEGPWRMVFDDSNRIIYAATWSGGAWALRVVDPVTRADNEEPAPSVRSATGSKGVRVACNRLLIERRADGAIGGTTETV